MLSYTKLLGVAPVGFNEKEHHWAFKYWTGSAVDKAQLIVRQVCTHNGVSNWFPSGKVRTEYATCVVKHNFNIFCRCCAISNPTQTLARVVGNLIARYCDIDEYIGGGLDYLEPYEEMMPKDIAQSIEVLNLEDIRAGIYTWHELIRRIYSRRHWMAVYELATQFVGKWTGFFADIEGRKEPFTEQEKKYWNEKLFCASPEITDGSLLHSQSHIAKSILQNATDVLRFTEATWNDEIIATILKSRPAHEIRGKWADSPNIKCRRRQFVDSIIDVREKQRRAINMIRLMENPECVFLKSPPPQMTLHFFGETSDKFDFPQRELDLCQFLIDDPRFDAHAYWPIYTEFSGEYRHCILQLDGIQFVQALEQILLSLGELTCATMWISPPRQITDRVLVAFLTTIDRKIVDTISNTISECGTFAAFPINVYPIEVGNRGLIQLCADIADEKECETLRYN
jgi:hypothetical protein